MGFSAKKPPVCGSRPHKKGFFQDSQARSHPGLRFPVPGAAAAAVFYFSRVMDRVCAQNSWKPGSNPAKSPTNHLQLQNSSCCRAGDKSLESSRPELPVPSSNSRWDIPEFPAIGVIFRRFPLTRDHQGSAESRVWKPGPALAHPARCHSRIIAPSEGTPQTSYTGRKSGILEQGRCSRGFSLFPGFFTVPPLPSQELGGIRGIKRALLSFNSSPLEQKVLSPGASRENPKD